MPFFTITVEDTSPLLQYFDNTKWMPATSRSDDFIDSYSQSSATITSTQGSTMQFTYYGSSVSVFGAKRANHGNYQGQLDGGAASLFEGGTPDQYQVELFNGNGGSGRNTLGMHTVTMTNLENKFFDIDFLTFETSVGNDDEDLIVNTFQDSHPAFTYTPPTSWLSPQKVGVFSGSSGHTTTDSAAIAKFTFQGDAVALYGPVGPNNTAKYSVQMDANSPTTYSAHHQFFKTQEMLFFAGNLGPGTHSLKIQLASPGDGGQLSIDYANVFTTSSLGGSFNGDNILSSGSGAGGISTSTKLVTPPGIIAGFALMTTLVVAAFFGFFYLYWRQQRRFNRMQGPKFLDLNSPVESSRTVSTFSVDRTSNQDSEYVPDPEMPIPFPSSTQALPQISQSNMVKMQEAYNLDSKRRFSTGVGPSQGSSSGEQGSSSQFRRLPQLTLSYEGVQRQRSGSSRSPLPQSVIPSSPGVPPPRYSVMTKQ